MKTPKLLELILAIFIVMIGGNLFGDTIFNETNGSAGSVTSVNSYTGWLNQGSVTYSGTSDARNTYNSSGAYPSASGGGNIYFVGGASEYLQITGINTLGYTNIRLACGIYKTNTNTTTANAEHGSNFQIRYSTDGSTWSSPLAYTLPTGAGTNAVYTWINFDEDLPAVANLYLKFTDVGATEPVHFRLDDVTLTGTTFNLYNETVGAGANGIALASYTGWINSDPIAYAGTAYVENDYTSAGSYSNATGTGSVLITNGTYFTVSGISTAGYSDIWLSIGVHKDSGSETGTNLKLEVCDGTVWTGPYYVYIPTSSSDIWINRCFGTAIPATATLTLKFTNLHATRDFRIDDIQLRAGIKKPTLASPTTANITNTTALLGASIASLNNSNATERGIYYSTTNGFTDGEGTKVSETGTFSATGAFTFDVIGLSPNTTYYYKGFATNAAGSGHTVQDSLTTTNVFPPTVTLPTAASITNTTAVLGATISSLNNSDATERGIYYSTTTGFADGEGTKFSETGIFSSTGAFTVEVTGFSPDTVYYYKGFTTNAAGSGYTAQDSLTTTNVFPPSVTANATTSLTDLGAILEGNISSTNNAVVTERGFYYSTSNGFTDGTGTKISETGSFEAGVYSLSLTGLDAHTQYYFKAFAANSVGTTYSAQGSIIPSAIPPLATIVSPVNASNVTITVTLNWTDGGGWTYGYKLFMGTDATATNLTPPEGLDLGYVSTYTPAVSIGSTYYWRIQPYNSFGNNTAGSINSFIVTRPLSGTKTIGSGGDYASFTAAINDLNTYGVEVGGGGITFNVTPGSVFTETMPIPAITVSGNLADQIIFQKYGTGVNPIVQATGTDVSPEYFIKLLGSDYVTFDGIDLCNTGTTTLMDYGFWLQAISSNGCSNNTIKNCTVTLDRFTNSTRAVNVYYYGTGAENNNNKFYNNTINNAFYGYYLCGSISAIDTGNEIGTTIGTADINNVYRAVYAYYQAGFKAYNQIISLPASAATDMLGFDFSGGTSEIYGNTVQNGSITNNTHINGLYHRNGGLQETPNQNKIYNNTFTGFTNSVGYCAGINVTSGCVTIYNNKIYNLSYTGTGTYQAYGIALSGTGSIVYNNLIWDLRAPASTSANMAACGIVHISGVNKVYNNTVYLNQTATGSGVVNTAALVIRTSIANTLDLQNNIFVNKSAVNSNSSSRTLAVYKSGFSTWTYMTASSGRNIYYASNPTTPGTGEFISFDGTTGFQTIDAYHTAAGTSDAISWSEDVPFDPSNLPHLATDIPTIAENAGLPITSPAILDDIDGNLRNTSAPDIGADEGNFTHVGLVPLAATTPSPANTPAFNVALSTTFSWTLQIDQTHGAPESFKFYLRTTMGTYAELLNGVDVGNVLSYTPQTQLLMSTEYIWKVVPFNAAGEAINPPEWSFRTILLPFAGVYTINNTLPTSGTNFASFTDAVNALNISGNSAPVTFTVSACQTFVENVPAITVNATAEQTVTFVKYGEPANPVIKAGVGTSATADAIVTFKGCDYITFDGIDLSENTGVNTTATTQAEYGFYFVSNTAADGTHHNTIINSNITLENASYNTTKGIHLSTTGTTTAGSNSYNKFYDNAVSGCYYGYSLTGSNSTSAEDTGNEVGSLTRGGTITNCSSGVYYSYQKNLKIYSQTILLAGGSLAGSSFGICGNSGRSNTVEIYNNNVSMAVSGTVASGHYGIYVSAGATASIHNNIIHDLSSTYTATGSSIEGIKLIGVDAGMVNNIYENEIYNFASLCHYQVGIYSSAPATNNIYNNVVHDLTGGATNGDIQRGISFSSGINNVFGNEIFNISITAGTGNNVSGLYAYSGINTVYGNTVRNLTNNSTGNYNLYGIHVNGGTSNLMYNNVVKSLASNTVYVYGFNIIGGTSNTFRNNEVFDLTYFGNGSYSARGINIGSGTTNYIYNNYISDIKAPACNSAPSPCVAGVWISGGTNDYLWYNTIFLNTTATGSNINSAGIYVYSSTPLLEMKNNILINKSATGTSGKAVAFRKNFTTWTSITSDNNIFYAGASDTKHLICYEGTNSYQTLVAYQTASGKDSHSYSGDINFVNSTTAPYNLDINFGLPSLADGRGVVISTPVAVIDDYHYQTRATGLADALPTPQGPDIGADEVTIELLPSSTPENISITRAAGTGNLVITWDVSTGFVSGYHIYSCPTRDFPPETTVLAGSTSASTLSLTLPAIDLPARMFFRVTAY